MILSDGEATTRILGYLASNGNKIQKKRSLQIGGKKSMTKMKQELRVFFSNEYFIVI